MNGNLLKIKAEALVNTVNCIGYMGKGIALQFKKAYPENNDKYEKACNAHEVRQGKMFVFETGNMFDPKYIINFPTKRHWRGKSRIEDIKSGMKDLVSVIKKNKISSIAIPPLGCGLGGLDWNQVKKIIKNEMQQLQDVRVILFEPKGSPTPKDMPVRTKKPLLTIARALFIKIIRKYSELAYRLTLLEIQKLAYFIQEAGEPLKLRYEEGKYGPYAHNLNKVLEILEGHYIRGYGDTQNPDVKIELLDGAIKAADEFLNKNKDANMRLAKVEKLIEGFETPYGMELLASIHWVNHHTEKPVYNVDDAIQTIYNWTGRKRKLFKEDHIKIAWNRLKKENWLDLK